MDMFSVEINKNTKKGVADAMRCDFSTTSHFEKAASNIITMSSMKEFFEYKMNVCGCGIQKVHFRGKKQDYEQVVKKILYLKNSYPINPDYVEYLEGVTKIVNKFIETIEGKVDLKFWNSIFEDNKGHGSGPSGREIETTIIGGWIKNFFGTQKLKINKIPSSKSSAPVIAIDKIKNITYNLEYKTEIQRIEEIKANVFRPVTVITVTQG